MPLDSSAKQEKKDTQQQQTAKRLLSMIERVERLNEEKKAISADITDIFAEAKACGFDVKVMRQMIKERAMDAAEAEEFQAMCELYRASLGMLNGTPLGEHARKRLEEKKPPEPTAQPPAAAAVPTAGLSPDEIAGMDAPKAPPVETARAFTPAEARAAGAAAAREGRPVSENPHPAGAARAAWDEGWCSEAGGDGMDIPAAWRRTPKKKPEDDKGEGA